MTVSYHNNLRRVSLCLGVKAFRHLVSTAYEVSTEHVDVTFNPTHVGVKEITYHPIKQDINSLTQQDSREH